MGGYPVDNNGKHAVPGSPESQKLLRSDALRVDIEQAFGERFSNGVLTNVEPADMRRIFELPSVQAMGVGQFTLDNFAPGSYVYFAVSTAALGELGHRLGRQTMPSSEPNEARRATAQRAFTEFQTRLGKAAQFEPLAAERLAALERGFSQGAAAAGGGTRCGIVIVESELPPSMRLPPKAEPSTAPAVNPPAFAKCGVRVGG